MTLEQLFGDILEVDPTTLTDASERETITNWDSLGHLNIVTALEETYGVNLSTADIKKIKTLGDARQVLQAKGVRA